MTSNYFDGLREKAREIDDGVNRLGMTWQTPYLLIGGYAECVPETTCYMKKLWESVQDTNDAVKKSQLELESFLGKTDEFLEDTKAIYDDLKEQCDSIDTVLAEYGYHYKEGDSAQKDNRNDSKDEANGRILNNEEEMPDIEIEFTPNLTWKCKAKSKKSDFFNVNQEHLTVTSIATPVIKSLKSAYQAETPAKGKD